MPKGVLVVPPMEGPRAVRERETQLCPLLEIVVPLGGPGRLLAVDSQFLRVFWEFSFLVLHSCVPRAALRHGPNDRGPNHQSHQKAACLVASDGCLCQLSARAQAQSERPRRAIPYRIQRTRSHAPWANGTKHDRQAETWRRVQRILQLLVPCFGFLDEEIRFGRFSLSRSSPSLSCDASAMSPNLLVIPKMNNTVASTPIETPGSPFSTFTKVVRLIIARWAIVLVEMRRRFRSSAKSEPSFFKVRCTGSGRDLDD